MPMLALETIALGRNTRTVAVSAAADEGLRRSIARKGVLSPIMVRPCPANPGLMEVVLGARRFAAAQALGHIEIPAEIRTLNDAQVVDVQIAENLQRQAMHPVDQWRAVRALIQDQGYTFEQAGAEFDLDERAMRRMEQLGRLHPTLLKLAEIELPTQTQLRQIAAASTKLQAQAAKIKGLIIARGELETVDWHRVAMCCLQQRIHRSVAIFDTAEALRNGLAWDEDLFAEPGADDQFSTADIDNFLKRQTKALQAQVAALVKQKKRHQCAVMKDNRSMAFPGGFKASYGKPDKLRANEWAFHAVASDGSIRIETAIDTKAAKAATKKAAARTVETSSAAAVAHAEENASDDDGAATTRLGGNGASTPPPSNDGDPIRPPFTKRGQALIASAKDDAVRRALDVTPLPPGRVIALLVLALCSNNVSFGGIDEAHFKDLALRLLAPGGKLLDLSDADLCSIGATAIGRLIRFDVPDTHWRASNGVAAEWIGAALDAGEHYPERFDSKDFLETASVAELKRAAEHASLPTGGTAAQLRERLIGRVPQYRPEAAQFGAAAPREGAR